ncbi:MAG: imidazole glycerol phosphate synthase subunit HisH [Gammaproteobacteria bacterium]|nr:imidazole glycerol phosphate synthase subunit HisH [Gammaproteobacteria bacterium]
MQISVIDLGIGNLRSVEQALNCVAPEADTIVTSDPAIIGASDKVVLPGQGAIGTWLEALRERQLMAVLQRALEEKPLLGICVGMQALFGYCEEDGGLQGLGLFAGSVRHFRHFHAPADKASVKLKIPQMGWNQVSQCQDHPLWEGIVDQAHFYFVHSFCSNLDNGSHRNVVFGEADYGHRFIAAVGRDNVFAVQFHPEKSHNDGLQLLKNFTRWNGAV